MQPHPNAPSPDEQLVRKWSLTPVEYLGGHANQHWRVESGGRSMVLTRYADRFHDIDYQLRLLARLRELRWPVPEAVDEPARVEGRTWCLFTWLPGAARWPHPDREERRARGRLLAELHDATAQLGSLRQRDGYALSDELIRDPELPPLLRDYELIRPVEGRILLRYLEHALACFDRIGPIHAETIVLHGDFSPWNLLFEGNNLTGVLDFEFAHLNYRVADFALSWRGYQDDVIEGYEEVRRLTDLDWELLLPAYWSWLFMGVKDEIKAITSGRKPAHDFGWQIRHLLKRSELAGRHAAYPE
ncbi:MAG: phosphotransferase [Dehalococcoidia bacterium]